MVHGFTSSSKYFFFPHNFFPHLALTFLEPQCPTGPFTASLNFPPSFPCCVAYFLTLKLEGGGSSKTLEPFYQTIWSHIQKTIIFMFTFMRPSILKYLKMLVLLYKHIAYFLTNKICLRYLYHTWKTHNND